MNPALPAGWTEQPLEALVDPARPITYGIVLPGPEHDGGVPYVRVVDMNDGTVRTDGLRSTSPAIAAKYGRSALKPDDVLLSIRGHVGRVAVVPPGLGGANLTQDTARIALGEECHVPFVRWALQGTRLQRWMERHKKGASVKGINLRDVRQIPVRLPPLSEQRRIAAILDQADGIRRKRREALRLTEELVQGTFMELVGPDHPAYSTWPQVDVEGLADLRKGSIRSGPFGSALKHSEFVDEGIAVLGIDNAVQNRFAWGQRRFVTAEKYAALKRYTVYPGDVIITIMGTTGRSAVVPDDIPLAVSTKHLATISVDRSRVEPEFLSNALHRDSGILRQIARSNRGAIMAGLNLGLIRKLALRLPPMEQQREFVTTLQRLRATEATMSENARGLNELAGSLAQGAFRGEL